MPYLTDYKRFVIENPHDGLFLRAGRFPAIGQ